MNQRAFNLFTALVSFVMIMLTIILTNSMTQTEDKAVTTLSDLELQSEIQAMADLARGDALQVFIYNLRYSMEGYITNPENYFSIEPKTKWGDVVKGYVIAEFGGACERDLAGNCLKNPDGTEKVKSQHFAWEVTKELSGILATGSSFGRYKVDLKQKDADMLIALNQAIVNSVNDSSGQQKFFELIGCTEVPGTNGMEADCNPGTFYVNLNLSRGAFFPKCLDLMDPNHGAECQKDDQMFETLPKVVVRKIGTDQTLETAILPRSKIRIYVPIRVFAYVAHAKKVADDYVYPGGSYSNDFVNIMEKLRLGLCDAGKCGVRKTNVLTEADPEWEKACPFSPGSAENPNETVSINAILNYYGGGSYKPGDKSDLTNRILEIIKAGYCEGTNAPFQQVKQNLPLETKDVQCDTIGTRTDDATRPVTTNESGYQGPDTFAHCLFVKNPIMELKYFDGNVLYRVSKQVTAPYTVRINDYHNESGLDLSTDKCKTFCEDPLNCKGAPIHCKKP